jgi:hypothetical protein
LLIVEGAWPSCQLIALSDVALLAATVLQSKIELILASYFGTAGVRPHGSQSRQLIGHAEAEAAGKRFDAGKGAGAGISHD